MASTHKVALVLAAAMLCTLSTNRSAADPDKAALRQVLSLPINIAYTGYRLDERGNVISIADSVIATCEEAKLRTSTKDASDPAQWLRLCTLYEHAGNCASAR